MLWDRGTWTPEVDDVDAALKKGDLKFTLNGYKLKGSWVLVRTSGRYPARRARARRRSRSWLLIKHRDDWAGEVDITEFAPQQREERRRLRGHPRRRTHPAVWESHRPGQGRRGRRDAGEDHRAGGQAEGRADDRTPQRQGRTAPRAAAAAVATTGEEPRRAHETKVGADTSAEDKRRLSSTSVSSRRDSTRPHRVREPQAIVARDLARSRSRRPPARSASGRSPERERLLVLERVAAEHLRRRPLHVGDHDVDRPSIASSIRATASAAVKPTMPRPSVSRFAIRMIGPCIFASASATPRTRKIGIRLV